MKLAKFLLCLMLLASTGYAANDVEIHFNYPDDNIYVGATNKLEIWIENDVLVEATSIGLEFSDYSGLVNWNSVYGNHPPLNEENDAFEAFTGISIKYGNLYDGNLPDSILFGGVALINDNVGLIPNSKRLCYTMEFAIPAGQPLGNICVKNVLYPPAGDWLFYPEFGPEFAPDFNGCSNTSVYTLDCSEICFPVVEVPEPVADFSFAPDSGDYPLTVSFTDLSLYTPTSWTWIFGDGQTSNEQHPSHDYLTAGTYYPTLVVTNSVGTDEMTSTLPIIVTSPPIIPGVSITCPGTQLTVSGITDTVTFTVENTGEDTDNFNFVVGDSLGWFLSPTFLSFALEGGANTQIPVGIIVPDGLGNGVENRLTATVTSQTIPSITDVAVCALVLDNELCGDVNLDGTVNVSDAVYIINFVFMGGAAPCEMGK
jgi:PKD repeat protein